MVRDGNAGPNREVGTGHLSTVLSLGTGCAGSPVAPFDSFKSAPITAYRLQNYEPPPAVAAAPTAPGQIPGLPPEIQKWVTAGAAMLPPGLVLPGAHSRPRSTGAAAAAVDNTPRFHNFRVLGMPTNVIDTKLRDELVDIFGFAKNFDDTHATASMPSSGSRSRASVSLLPTCSCRYRAIRFGAEFHLAAQEQRPDARQHAAHHQGEPSYLRRLIAQRYFAA